MPRPTQIPLSRAAQHLAAGRFAEAAGAFRAALHVDPRELRAMLGLADCALGRGQREAAYFHLVEAGRACVERDEPLRALELFTRAIGLDPSRLEVHLDVAEAELALERTAAALTRLESLASAYVDVGRAEEAAEVLRFVASLEASSTEVEVVELARVPTSETVVCSTILITPEGKPFVVRGAGVPTPVRPQHTESITRRTKPVAAKPVAAKPVAAKPEPLPKSDIASRLRKHAGLPGPSAPPPTKRPSKVVTAPHRIAAPPRPASAAGVPREEFDDQRTRLYRLPTIPPAALA